MFECISIHSYKGYFLSEVKDNGLSTSFTFLRPLMTLYKSDKYANGITSYKLYDLEYKWFKRKGKNYKVNADTNMPSAQCIKICLIKIR